MLELTHVIVLGVLSILGIGIVWAVQRQGSVSINWKRWARVLLVGLAVISVAAYFRFGLFHSSVPDFSRNNTTYCSIHYWEQFHYYLNSKYIDELNYTNLYAASIVAEKESRPRSTLPRYIRNLESNQMIETADVLAHPEKVKSRFSPKRWAQFVRDNEHFLKENSPEYMARIRVDHGFNGTPTWLFTARLFTGWLPASRDSMVFLGGLDVFCMALAFFFIFRAYGYKVGCMSLILWGLGYAGRYYWIGGALLRTDWLCASIMAICLVKKEKYFWAGNLFAYAAMTRVFPVFFLFGMAVIGLKTLVLTRKVPTWTMPMIKGLSSGLLICLIAGSIAGGGVGIWKDFYNTIKLHHGTYLTNNVAPENVIIYDKDIMSRRFVDWDLDEPWTHVQKMLDESRTEKKVFILLLTAALIGAVGFASWRAEPDEACIISLGVIFAIGALTCYYWIMWLLVPLRRDKLGTLLILLLNAILCAVHYFYEPFETRYGLMSWGLCIFFFVWLLPEGIRLLRQKPKAAYINLPEIVAEPNSRQIRRQKQREDKKKNQKK